MKKTLINDNFECKILFRNEDFLDIKTGLDDNGYEPVSIPHDALIGDANNFYSDRIIWYRRRIGITPSEGKRLFLYFEGVYMDASVYINDSFVGKWVNGYTSFCFDVTEYVNSADDYIYVSIDYHCPNSRWYAGPGINRDVWLYEASDKHFVIDSLYVCPEKLKSGEWSINASVNVNYSYVSFDNVSRYASSSYSISDTSCTVIFHCDELNLKERMTFDKALGLFTLKKNVCNPILWDTVNPHIYHCYATLSQNSITTLDTIDTSFGFRHVEMTVDKGLFLNGNHVKLNGVCLHSDQGCLGTAFHKDMARRQLELMKEMGANAIRLTHNVQAPAFLELCDELGLLVLNEAFDCWKLPKTPYDYARFFEEWSERDIRAWIMRDRNHPCVIMWSAGNEIYDTHAGKDGAETLLYIRDEIRKNDFYNHAPVTLCSNYMAWTNTINAVDNIKFAGYNYGEHLYEEHHSAHPDWIMFGSETGSLVQSRGVYHFPLSKSFLVDDDEHCSSLGNCCTSWGAPLMDKCVTTERDSDYSLGQFLWAGIDYLGEPTPYHTKSSYFGLADTATFPKDIYYMLQSCWTSFDEKPMIHLLPYWDFNEGQLIDIRICSNAPEVELFFAAKSAIEDAGADSMGSATDFISLGRQKIDHEQGDCMYADYRLPYGIGTLKAIGYDKAGNAVVSTCEASFGDTAALELKTSRGDNLEFVEIQAIDKNGNPVKNASDRINIEVEGPGELIGLCNGNQTDMDSFTGKGMRLFNGKLLAVIKLAEAGGSANAKGNISDVKVNATIDKSQIPVRKLDISLLGSDTRTLTPTCDTVIARINICPANAQYKEIEYRITNEGGVPIQNARISSISPDGLTVTIKAVADAVFTLRALCREEDDRITVISTLEFVATGFGELNRNPYEFVSGSLFDDHKGELGNGNERGTATLGREDTYILYKNLDFGINGSDTITVPIFELGGQPVKVAFWKGMPHSEGSSCIGDFIYQKPSIWNVYQEETFTLTETLTGIQDLGLEIVSDKIHIKGFVFSPKNTTYEPHQVRFAQNIYGDQYIFADDCIKGIGNNVCITYKDMDFGVDGATRITIKGRTPLKQNTIHIRFNKKGAAEQRQIIEFPYSSEMTEITFELENICGKGDLNFLFLPGSDFDFSEFRFE